MLKIRKNKKMSVSWSLISFEILLLIALVVGGYSTYKYLHGGKNVSYKTAAEAENVYVRFDMEAYDTILANYWMIPGKYSENGIVELPQVFALSLGQAEAVQGTPNAIATSTIAAATDRASAAAALAAAFKMATSTDEEKNLALNTLAIALNGLLPQGRNGLQSAAQETSYRDIVSNVNTSNDLYQNLGLTDGASAEQVTAAYQQKAAALQSASATSSAAAAELAQDKYAENVLTTPSTKAVYDQTKAEPTVFPTVIGKTLYLYVSRMAPTTFQEFGLAIEDASTTPLNSLIVDLRGNIGGQLDFLPNVLGLWIGSNQYAFDIYQQGNLQVIRTTQPKFPQVTEFREVAVLTDANSKSTAELTAETFRHFGIAKVVGVTSGGWGTIENNYPISTVIDPTTAYSLLLVNSITLRDDNQPIQGNGVVPDVDTSKAGWQNQLPNYFFEPSIITALKQVATAPSIK